MKVFAFGFFVLVAVGYMETRFDVTNHNLAMYEQQLNQRLAIESLPARMIAR